MTVDMTTVVDPEQAWHEHAFEALKEATERPLDLWNRSLDGEWELVGQAAADGTVDFDTHVAEAPRLKLIELLEKAAERKDPCAANLDGTRHLLAFPLNDTDSATTSIAVTAVETDNVDVLVGMAAISQRFHRQQAQLVRLKEENDYFLKQISDDFEELTFLRAMAERLNLGGGTHDLGQLIRDSVPRLGESVHAEALYFVDGSSTNDTHLAAAWHGTGIEEPLLDEPMILHLAEDHRDAAAVQPVIKNRFAASDEGLAFPGVRDFVLVAVSSSMGPVGWYLAVNRYVGPEDSKRGVPQWRLSQHEFGSSEASLLNTAGAMLASHANNLALFRERENLLVSVVRTLVSAIEAKDGYTRGHSERVARYGRRLAEQLGYDEEKCERLYLTGLLHDIGKIAVSDAVLNKPGQLTDEEFAEIKRHPDEGWRILHELAQLNYVLPGVLYHHERPDGTGYPDGLAGDDIPLDGRILAVADAYDAMTSDRAYRKGMSHSKAEEILREGAGTQWDAEAIDAFLAVAQDIVALREQYQPRQRPHRREPAATATV